MLIETWLEQAPKRAQSYINDKRTYMTPRRLAEAMVTLGYEGPHDLVAVLGVEYRLILEMLRGKRAIPRYIALAVRALEINIDV